MSLIRFNDESHQKSLSETLRSFCYTRGRDASSGSEMKPKVETNIVSASIRRCGGAPRGAETVSRNSLKCGGSELRVRRRSHFRGDGECPG